ncbi:MAG: hypothetical protein E7640_03885 [Ruminococcaceae bacterium]|nr:hypothetical protein [Oscillospiraceae bacterium]
MITFVYGAPGHGKTHYVFSALAENYENSILLVPEQHTVTAERRALEVLPSVAQLNFEVLNFSRLSNRVFRMFGGLSYHYINAGARSLFMWRTLRELSPLLEEYSANGNELSLTPVMLNALSELKNAGVSPSELESAADKLGGSSPLRAKLRDLSLVFSAYENLVKQSYDDATDDLYKLCEIVDREKIFLGKKIYIDSFSSFTAPELAVIRRIFSQADDVTVTLGCESPNVRMISNESINETAKALSEIAKAAGKKVNSVFLTENHRAANAELSSVNSSLWSLGAVNAEDISEDERGNIRIINTKNAYSQADAVVSIILSELKRGLRYREIAVIARDISTYRGILDPALAAAGIPYFMSTPSELAAKPVVRLLTSALRIKALGFRTEDVLANTATGLYRIDDRDADLFSEYVNTWNIQRKQFLEPWSMNPDGYTGYLTERGKKILAAANRVREALVGDLTEFFTMLDAAENVRGMCRAVYHYFERIELQKTLRARAAEELDLGHRREAADLLAVWNLEMGILDDIASALGDEKLSADEFLRAFTLAVSTADTGAIPTGYDEVTLGSASLLRTEGIKCAILIGMNEDEFPYSVRDTGLFSDTDRKALSALGLTVSSDLGERTSEEFLYARRAMTAPSERLYMLFCTSAASGKLLRPSLLIGRVQKLLPYIEIESYEKAPLSLTVLSPSTAASRITGLIPSADSVALREILTERGILPSSTEISEPDCTLDPETADLVFGDKLYLSQSRIDKYVLCAFNYACEYILELRDDEKAQVGFNIMGSFVHSLLEEILTLASRREELDFELNEDKTAPIADRIIENLLDEICPDEKKRSARISHLFLRLRRLAMLMLSNLRDEFAHSEFTPEFFELRIGGDAVDPMTFSLPDGTEVRISGFIDRVDIMKKDGEIYIRVIDYKTGAKEFSFDDIKNGQNLQLLIYLFALCRPDTEFARRLGCEDGQAPIPAAAHYLSSAVSVKKLDTPQPPEEILADAESRLSRSGIYRNDPMILHALNSESKKNMLGGIVEKDGTFSGKGLVAPSQFDSLKKDLENTLSRIAISMREGRADAAPISPDLEQPCKYCKMSPICRSAGKKAKKGEKNGI